MAGTIADRVAALSSDQRVRLLRKMVEAGQPLAPVLGVVPRRAEAGPAPLSQAQEDLWMFESLYPDTAAINLCSAYHFDKPVEAEGLETALGWVIANHDILRGRVIGTVGSLRMVVDRPATIAFERVDLRGTGVPMEQAYQAAVEEFRRRTFDLAEDPLVRGVFIALDDTRRTLILGVHHIVTDWWSFDVLHTEFSKAYRAFLDGVPYPTRRPDIQYADYAAWQYELEAAGVHEQQLDFWRRYLADLPPAPRLGVQKEQITADFAAGQVEYFLDPTLIEAARTFAKDHDATLFHVLMAAFAVLTSRLSGSADVVVGTPLANRSAKGLRDIIGYVMNMVATRWQVVPTCGFGTMVTRFAASFADLLANADVPIGRVVADRNPERSLGRSPLIRWVFMYLPGQESIWHLPEAARHERLSTGTEENDFALILRDNRRGSTLLTCEFRADLFDAALVREWTEAYRVLLAGLLADGARAIGDVPMLGVEAAAPAAPPPAPPVHETVADLARRTPDAPAVLDGDSVLTYAELDERASAVAALLIERDLPREAVVAVCLPRTADFPVALLGILKAGAAFLPLDPAYPAERLRYLLADSGAGVVLATGQTADAVRALDIEPVLLDAETGAPPAALAVPVANGGLAYVIYTSGSTGTPKGVAVEHAALASLAARQAESFGLTAADRALQFASHSFDVALEEVFSTLVAGACLVVGDSPGRTSLADLAATVERHGVSVLNLPTGYWHELVRTGQKLPASVRLVVIGGEAADPAAVRDWFATAPTARLVNAYGPTETTVTSLSHRVADGDSALAIGRPPAELTARVLDARLQPVPAGVIGELYVGGARLARGYLGRSALTAERFVADPSGDGTRMYRTGDRCWYDGDGVVHFAGRADGQLKIRGFRVEPREVEAALTACDGVGRAVVVARNGGDGSARLAAYVVPGWRPGTKGLVLDPESLRRALAAKLPDHMVPASVTVLAGLPLAPSGKLDRAALPDPAATAAAQPTAATRPMSEHEQALADLFAEVLAVPTVGPDDDFFALGGHSLLATRLVARIRSVLDAHVELRAVFEAPTVAGLAGRLGAPARVRPVLGRRAQQPGDAR